MTTDGRGRALLLTVGTGDAEQLEETLLAPLRKSIEAGEWQRIILLPSSFTAANAERLRGQFPDRGIEIKPLPAPGLEDDPDACFAFFDSQIQSLMEQGFACGGLVVDFTRGTKAMSAALVLAAIRHDVPTLRYISSPIRDRRGMAVPGKERISQIQPSVVMARKTLDLAEHLFRRGDFAAIEDVLPDPRHFTASFWPEDLLRAAAAIRPLAVFCAAWDRLDYKSAAGVRLGAVEDLPPRWSGFHPPASVRDWVGDLASDAVGSTSEKAKRLRCLAADLLANGERRIRGEQFEDAILRAYRIYELVGQTRLLDHGLDSAAIPPDHPAVVKTKENLEKNKQENFTPKKDGKLQAARMVVTRLLDQLGDKFGRRLRQEADKGLISPSKRNLSVLIHGYTAVSPQDRRPLLDLYNTIEQLILDDAKDRGEDATERLATARFLDFSRL